MTEHGPKSCVACGRPIPVGLFCVACTPAELAADLAGRLEAALRDLADRDRSGIALRDQLRAQVAELQRENDELRAAYDQCFSELQAAENQARDLALQVACVRPA